MDYNPPGSSGHGILQERILECVVIPFSRTQRSDLTLQLCRWVLYHLSHQGSPRILEWIVTPFSRGSFQPRDQTWVSRIAGRFFTVRATKEGLKMLQLKRCTQYVSKFVKLSSDYRTGKGQFSFQPQSRVMPKNVQGTV